MQAIVQHILNLTLLVMELGKHSKQSMVDNLERLLIQW